VIFFRRCLTHVPVSFFVGLILTLKPILLIRKSDKADRVTFHLQTCCVHCFCLLPVSPEPETYSGGIYNANARGTPTYPPLVHTNITTESSRHKVFMLANTPPGHDPSSSLMLTSPPLNHAGSPYARVPLPPLHDGSHTVLSIHPILRFSLRPAMTFDLILHPSTITTLPEHQPLPHTTLSEPATNPPSACLNITSPFLPWFITVLPSSHAPNRFVTVSDVLITLHRSLGFTVMTDEYQSLSSEVRYQVNATFHRRVNAISDWRLRESERRVGARRIDFLMGRNHFIGLSKMGSQSDVLVLNLV
jgi:hypothetical protein